MARKFLTGIDLAKNELQNGVVQNLGSAPGSPVKGQLYFNSSDNTLYWWDGSAWASARGGGTGFPGFGSVTQEQAFGATKSDGVATTTARADHTHGNPVHDNAAHSAITLNSLALPTGPVSMNGQKLTSVGTPTVGTDAVTKDYADNLSAGLSWKEAVRIATTANITQSGLTAIDGVTPSAGDRILCKDQSTGSQNGIWVAAAGAWARSTDADALGELDGATVFVMEGTANADKAFTCTTNAPITPGTTATTWVQFGAGTSYSAGAGLTLTGSTFDVVAANGSITVAADSIQVAFAGTGAAVTAARSDHTHDGTYTKKFAADCTANASQVVTHNLNTKDVTVAVYTVASTFDEVECDIQHTSVNTITAIFAIAPTAGQYRFVVTG